MLPGTAVTKQYRRACVDSQHMVKPGTEIVSNQFHKVIESIEYGCR